MNKKIAFWIICLFLANNIKAQVPSILPAPTSEQCPNIDIIFTVSLPGVYTTINVAGTANNVAPVVVQQPTGISNNGTNTTFTFKGRFVDNNNKQTFTVNYYNFTTSTWLLKDFTFDKIKSLLTSNSYSQIYPSPTAITSSLCQITTHTISFANVTYGNPWVSPQIGYGSISNYEYLLPAGWSIIGSGTSNGSNWIAGGNSVTVQSDLTTGNLGMISIRPVNTACGTGLSVGQVANVSISRPAPLLSITSSQNYICANGSTTTFTMNGMPAGSTIAWSLPAGNPDVQITGCSTCSGVTLQRTSVSDREVTVTGTVTNCGIPYIKTAKVILGKPITTCQEIGNGICTQMNFLCASQLAGWKYINLVGSWDPSVAGFHLQVNGGGYFNNGLTTQDIIGNYFSVYVPSGGNNVTVWAMNACGVSQSVPYVIVYALKGYGCSGGYTVTPNPATSNITVAPAEGNSSAQNSTAAQSFNEIQIVDKLGNLKKKLNYANGINRTSIDISSLPTDTYIVRINSGGSWEEYKIIVVK